MSDGFDQNNKAIGLYRHPNNLDSPNGALLAADECVIIRENQIDRRKGFSLCNGGLPAATPQQMFTGNNSLFVHINGSIYYKDSSACTYSRMLNSGATVYNFNTLSYDAQTNTIFIADQFVFTVRKLTLSNNYLSTISGASFVSGYVDGAALAARYERTFGTFKVGNNLYITDYNAVIRKLNLSTNVVSTVAGLAGASGNVDGIGAAARLDQPAGMCGDSNYIYFLGASTSRVVRRFTIATAQVDTIAGVFNVGGTADGIGAAARFYELGTSTVIDGNTLYVGDYTCIRTVDLTTFQVTTIAGLNGIPGIGDVDGPGATARMNGTYGGMASDANYVYFSDIGNSKIKKMTKAPPYTVTTIAGDGTYNSRDGVGLNAQVGGVAGMALVGDELYFCGLNFQLRKLNIVTGEVYTLTSPGSLTSVVDGYISLPVIGP